MAIETEDRRQGDTEMSVPRLSRVFRRGLFFLRAREERNGWKMETRVAILSIIVENPESVEPLNALLHECGQYIVGRMGLPYHKRKINVISIVIDAPQDVISTLSGKIGMLPNVSTKTAYSNVISQED